MNDLQIPALVMAIPIGLAAFARGVLWLKEIMKPLNSGNPTRGNGTGEWRGRMLVLAENQQRSFDTLIEGQKTERKMLYDHTRSIARMAELIESHDKRETRFWEEALVYLKREDGGTA